MRHRTACFVFGLALLLVCPWQALSEDRQVKAGELLARYEAFVNGIRRLRFDSLEAVHEKGGVFKDWTWTAFIQTTFARTGEAWRIRTHEVGFNYYDGRRIPFDLEAENTYDGKAGLIVNKDFREARSLAPFDEENARKRLEIGGSGPVETDVSAEIDAEKPMAIGEYAIQNQTGALYGYLPGDGVFAADLLRQGANRLSVKKETVNGRNADVLEGVTRYGVLSLWLDPSADFAPIRLRMRKAGNDMMGKTRMRSMKASGDSKESTPNLPLREFEFQVDYRAIRLDGQNVIAGYTRTDRFIYEGGSDYWRRVVASLDGIRLKVKPQDLEPTLAIPDETPVRIRNAPAMLAKWSAGKLVMGYDKPKVASLKANWTTEESTSVGWAGRVVIAAAGLLVLGAGALGWRRFQRARRPDTRVGTSE